MLIGPSLLLTASGTQRAPHSRDFLYWSAASAGVCRERSTVMVSLPAHDSEAAPCLHGCPAFLQKHPPPWTFSPWPTAVRALGLLSNPHAFLAPSPVHSGGLASLSRVCRAGAQIFCVVLTPFRLSRWAAAVSDSLRCFPSVPSDAPMWGSDPCFSSSPSSLVHAPFFPFLPSSYRVLSGVISSFLMVRGSWQYLAGFLQDLLHMKIYPWCIRGERHTPGPPTPPPSWLLVCCWCCCCFEWEKDLDI